MDQDTIDILRARFIYWLKGSGLDANDPAIRVAAWNAYLEGYKAHE